MISRNITPTVQSKIGRGKAIMIIEPIQVDKTTLILDQLQDKDYTFYMYSTLISSNTTVCCYHKLPLYTKTFERTAYFCTNR